MADLDLANLTIPRAAEALRTKQISALELADAYLQRIEQLNPRLNAYITVTGERELRPTALAVPGDPSSAAFAVVAACLPHGVPVTLKMRTGWCEAEALPSQVDAICREALEGKFPAKKA